MSDDFLIDIVNEHGFVDKELGNNNQKQYCNSWHLIEPEVKLRAEIVPFLTFPLLKACNLRCGYCGEGGELSASMAAQWNADEVVDRIYRAHRRGVRKFRLTGGEPFLFKGIESVLKALNELGAYTHVNTNACYITKHKTFLSSLESNVHFAVSLDSLDHDNFDQIVGRRGFFEQTIAGIEVLRSLHRLLRINMVVTTQNAHEIFDMIDYCRDLQCNLKLLDVVSVPLPFGNRKDLHVCLNSIEKQLAEQADSVHQHEYARAFGTPCRIYKVKGVEVTVKNTWNGSRYDTNGICRSCEYFPCHEGLYDIFALPDGRVVGCRWSDSSVAATNAANDRYTSEHNFEAALDKMASIFQRAQYVARDENESMRPYPYFVMHSLDVKQNIVLAHDKAVTTGVDV